MSLKVALLTTTQDPPYAAVYRQLARQWSSTLAAKTFYYDRQFGCQYDIPSGILSLGSGDIYAQENHKKGGRWNPSNRP
jgi:hypothetical protein